MARPAAAAVDGVERMEIDLTEALRQLAAQLKIVVVAGVASNSGKTTLLCELLRALTPAPDAPALDSAQAWEAIKLTRGHYRSCGKDPHACCVSDLLGAQPTVRSGRAATFAVGKDTGRYWEAGASNVHWIVATDEQVAAGLQTALARVQTAHVLIEGTSVLRYLKPNFTILVGATPQAKLKPSARRALHAGQIDALYLPENTTAFAASRIPTFTPSRFAELLALLRAA